MTERAEFAFDPARLRASGLGMIFLGVLALAMIPAGVAEGPVLVICVVLGLASVGIGVKQLHNRGKIGAQVVVDRDGITDIRISPDPIPWADVQRCEVGIGPKGSNWLRLVLRTGSATEARLGKSRVNIQDTQLMNGRLGVRLAIARLAPQVPRDW